MPFSALDTSTRRGFLTGMTALSANAGASVSASIAASIAASIGTSVGALAQQACVDIAAPRSPGRRETPLGALNARARWGVAIGAPGLYDARYTDIIAAERPRHLAIANAVKFDFLHGRAPAAGAPLAATATWAECDDIIALATRLGVPVRADALAWNDWNADWLKALVDAGDRAQAKEYFRQHFEGLFAHFASRALPDGAPLLEACGLVNEALDPWHPRGREPGWREGPWLTAFGMSADGVPGYIHAAFEHAERFARPRTKLFLNESNCDNDKFGPMLRPAMLNLIDRLQRAGRRVDAVGLECHLMPQWMANPAAPDWRPFMTFVDEIAKRGIEVYLTELDVNDCSLRDARDRYRLVADTLRGFVTAALRSPAVTMVTSWDLSDRFTWYRDAAVYRSLSQWADCVRDPPCPRPTPYDAQLSPKSARGALADALSGAPGGRQ